MRFEAVLTAFSLSCAVAVGGCGNDDGAAGETDNKSDTEAFWAVDAGPDTVSDATSAGDGGAKGDGAGGGGGDTWDSSKYDDKCMQACLVKGLTVDKCKFYCPVGGKTGDVPKGVDKTCYLGCIKGGGSKDVCTKKCPEKGGAGASCYDTCVKYGGGAAYCKTGCSCMGTCEKEAEEGVDCKAKCFDKK